MAEQSSYTALVMDRSDPLGNSQDVFDRRALHTKVGNKPSEPIPTYLTSPANTFFVQTEETTDPGNDKLILSGTLANDTLMSRLAVSCRSESRAVLKINGEFVAAIRTGAAQPNASFQWEPKRMFPSGSTYEVTIKSRPGSPINTCDAHMMGIETI